MLYGTTPLRLGCLGGGGGPVFDGLILDEGAFFGPMVSWQQIKESLKHKNSFSYDELVACAHGKLFGPGNAQLPLPPMLMFDRITKISDSGGVHGKGEVEAELDIKPDLWFFKCHFEGDPVMPGCLGLDSLWQLVGFFLGWLGAPGKGRALGVGDVKFSEMVLPSHKLVSYHLDLKRVILRRLVVGIADGFMKVDGKIVYEASDLKVGLFETTPEPA